MINKKVIIVVSVIIILAIILTGIIILVNQLGNEKEKSDLEVPKAEDAFVKDITEELEPNLLEYQEYKNFKYKTTKVEYEKNELGSYQINFAMEFINNSAETQKEQYVEINFFNEEERLLGSTVTIIGELKEGEKTDVVVYGDEVLRYTTKVEAKEYVDTE